MNHQNYDRITEQHNVLWIEPTSVTVIQFNTSRPVKEASIYQTIEH
jgi:hypothetical protein